MILTHEEAKALRDEFSNDPLELIREVEAAVLSKLAAGVSVEPVAWRVWIGDMTAQEYIYSEIGDGEPLYTADAIAQARVKALGETALMAEGHYGDGHRLAGEIRALIGKEST